MAVQWDGGYWYAVRPRRRRVVLADDGTAPDSAHPGVEAAGCPLVDHCVNLGDVGAIVPDVPSKGGRFATFGPYTHDTHGVMFLLKVKTQLDADNIPGIRAMTRNAIQTLAGSKADFERLRCRYRDGEV